MSKRGSDVRLRPPPPPRAREAMVTLDLDSQAASVESETLVTTAARLATGQPLPFRTTRSEPPSSVVAPPSLPVPSGVAPTTTPQGHASPGSGPSLVGGVVGPSAAAPPLASRAPVLGPSEPVPPLSSRAPALATRTGSAAPSLSPWAGARVRPVEPGLPASSTEVAPPPLLTNTGPEARAVRPAPRSEPGPASGPLLHHGIDLVALRPEAAPRVRDAWAPVLEDAAPATPDEKLKAAFDPSGSPSPQQARRWCVRVMSRAVPASDADVRKALVAATDPERDGEPTPLLLAGELNLSFDELETLRATVAAVAPYLTDDEALAKAVGPGKQLLEDRSLQGSRDAALELAGRIRAACRESAAVDDAEIGRRVERTLVEARAFLRRNLVGAKWVRAVLAREGAAHVCYLPESMAASLPLYASFPARVIGDIQPRQDHEEVGAAAVSVVAIGRLIEKSED